MNKKEHLEVQKIYQYQNFTEEELDELFSRLGIKEGARLFYLMLKSFGIAARVANAAWGFYKEWQNQSNGIFREEEKLAEALHDYAPDHFGVPGGHLDFAATCFEEFYNQASGKTKEEIEELIFVWTKRLRDDLAAQRAKEAELQEKARQEQAKKTKRKPVTP
jgi:hypothetical protein